jgi:SPP1 family predicted phage head-tail adaptor
MFFSDKITLRAYTTTRDEYGDPINSPIDTEVWANVKDVRQSEFYAANTKVNVKSKVFEVHIDDYAGQIDALYTGKPYEIIRTYQRGLGTVELICSDKAV